jgi:hypothetical protein
VEGNQCGGMVRSKAGRGFLGLHGITALLVGPESRPCFD